jgi:hypothetical protein
MYFVGTIFLGHHIVVTITEEDITVITEPVNHRFLMNQLWWVIGIGFPKIQAWKLESVEIIYITTCLMFPLDQIFLTNSYLNGAQIQHLIWHTQTLPSQSPAISFSHPITATPSPKILSSLSPIHISHRHPLIPLCSPLTWHMWRGVGGAWCRPARQANAAVPQALMIADMVGTLGASASCAKRQGCCSRPPFSPGSYYQSWQKGCSQWLHLAIIAPGL